MWTIMLGHSSRYGAGLLNVVQIDFLQDVAPLPFPSLIVLLVSLAGFCALLAAFGVWIRGNIILACIGYSLVYFWSQADSYQHHYFVALLMFICAFVPSRVWQKVDSPGSGRVPVDVPDEADASTDRNTLWHWAIQLIYVQVGIMYFWTAWTKLDPTWMTGLTMDQLTSEPCIRDQLMEVSKAQDISPALLYQYSAIMVVLGEFFAAFAFIVPRLRVLGLLIVPWFHVGVEMLGFDIEWFSYYMIGVNLVLLSPNLLWLWIDRAAERSYRSSIGQRVRAILSLWPDSAALRVALAGAASGVVYVITTQLPFPGWEESLAGALSGLTFVSLANPISLQWRRLFRPTQGLLSPSLAVLAAWLMVSSIQASDISFDFYRNWAGDFKRRQKLDQAIEHYELANRVKGPNGPARVMNIGDVYTLKAKREKREAQILRNQVVRLNEEISRQRALNPLKARELEELQEQKREDIARKRRAAEHLEHEVAYLYYLEAVDRLEPYLTEARAEASSAQTDAGLYFDLASDELRAQSRYRKLAGAMRNRSAYLTRSANENTYQSDSPAKPYDMWKAERLKEAAELLESAKTMAENASVALNSARSALEKAQGNEACPGPDERRIINQVRRARG